MGSAPGQPENAGVDLSHVGYTPTAKVSEPWSAEKVIESIGSDAPVEGSTSLLPFFHILERLKTTKREGWRRFGIYRGESIADHMYRMSMISMFAPPTLAPKLDLAKCMKMCLIHDMAELLVGDITPVDGVPKPEKSRREADTMDYLTKVLLRNADATTGKEMRAIWQEYEDAETIDSHYIHDVDKMELLLQMMEYERAGKGKVDLGEFAYVSTKMTLPEMRERAEEVIREREEFWGNVEHVHGEKGHDGGVSADHSKMSDDYYHRE